MMPNGQQQQRPIVVGGGNGMEQRISSQNIRIIHH
jgi:hypothetical protein